jgi:hypothetical protein
MLLCQREGRATTECRTPLTFRLIQCTRLVTSSRRKPSIILRLRCISEENRFAFVVVEYILGQPALGCSRIVSNVEKRFGIHLL